MVALMGSPLIMSGSMKIRQCFQVGLYTQLVIDSYWRYPAHTESPYIHEVRHDAFNPLKFAHS